MSLNPEKNWFGEKPVDASKKADLVRGVFDNVASNYDLMNDLMSGGVHRLWKDRLVRIIRPRNNQAFLDVAGGTGDIAFRIKKKAPEAAITVCDINTEMLKVGRDRAIDKGWLNGFDWVTGNAESLPVPDSSIDVYTIAFGLRNVTHIDTALKEAVRVLKPGGRFFCLEFSKVQEPIFARAYDAFSFKVIPQIGHLVAKDRDSYQYLVESIRRHPDQKTLQRRMSAAGMDGTGFYNLSGGIAAIHYGNKS